MTSLPKLSSMRRKKPDQASLDDSIRKRMFRLKFQHTEPLAVNLREYGLMQTSRKTDTPYPRAEKAIDPSLLKARLVESKKMYGKDLKNVPSMQSTGSVEGQNGQNLQHIRSVEAAPGPMRDSASLLLGTPHPRKGKAVDPKSLIRHLSTAKVRRSSLLGAARTSYGHLPSSRASLSAHARESDSGQHSSQSPSALTKHNLGIGTPHPIKGYILNPHDLTKRLEDRVGNAGKAGMAGTAPRKDSPLKRPQGQKKGKKQVSISLERVSTEDMRQTSCLSFGSARHDGASLSGNNSSFLTVESSHESTSLLKLSFEERRRLFYQSEFTIAKNGRKMSDVVMAVPQKVVEISDKHEWQGHDEEADEELEEFIKKQGLIKTERDQLTITKMPPATLSRRSSETDSLRSRSRGSRRSSMRRFRSSKKNIKFSASDKEKKPHPDV
ncbi:uncharacterized protein LOC108154980 [Drosophila miranda]|uniref:uncharacterized protein LOC108154980 n=1 Tax=Drosophila miranda TaxID=7229 RepID=UPI0007E85AF5|nr:uncharacterized protein LOC108154980 [Drosophila miranda]